VPSNDRPGRADSDKMVRKADNTYTVTIANLTLDQAVQLIAEARNSGSASPIHTAQNEKDTEVHYRD